MEDRVDHLMKDHSKYTLAVHIQDLEYENARLREALIATNYSLEQLCVALDVDPEETFIRVKNSKTGEIFLKKSLADIFAQALAALAEQEEK